jgi:hypothetical protein
MTVTICRHIKTNGRQCKSPSLGLSAFCYFHSRLHRRHRNLVENSSTLAQSRPDTVPSASGTLRNLPEYAAQDPIELDLPPAEDAESIQVSISLLIAALARNRIDSKRAAVLLYGLQLASTNVKSINIEPYASSVTRALTRTKSGLDLAIRHTASDANCLNRSNPKPIAAPPETPVDPIYNENL